MRIKVDEDLPPVIALKLREHGYAAISVIEQRLGGWKDPELWKVIQAEGRFLITADKGFADLRVYPPGTHSGVLLLRPAEDGIRPLMELLEMVLQSYDLNALAGTVAVANPQGIRVRRN